MIYTNITLNQSQLLAFLAKPNNGFTDHYVSSQPLNLYIPYTSYIDLVKTLVDYNLDITRVPLSNYRNAILKGSNSKYSIRLYYYELALAGLAELRKSHISKKLCTRIFPKISQVGLEEKEVIFSETPNFTLENINKDELSSLHKEILDVANIPIDVFNSLIIGEDNSLIENTYMYYMCLNYYGIFKYSNINYVINVKEE